MYAKWIDRARLAVAVAMVVCAAGVVVCGRQDDYFSLTLRSEPGAWRWATWAFGAGVAACLMATFAFVVEYLAHPTGSAALTARSLLVRSLIVLVVILVIGFLMTFGFGTGQGVGAVIGTILLLSAKREQRGASTVLGILAAIVLALTFLSTLSTYQYARRNANAIVAAGCELMDTWPKTELGQEVQVTGAQIPEALHSLGVRRVWIEEDFAFVLVPGFPGSRDREFVISRDPDPITIRDSVWIKSPSNKDDMIRINDRLWMTDY